MAKVFVVTHGTYSYYHIVGVFSSREKAAEFCPAAAAEVESAGIEEYELDAWEGDEFLQQTFSVYMEADTGNLDQSLHYDTPALSQVDMRPRDYREVHLIKRSRPDDRHDLIYAISTVSAEHALKLAADFRQAILRENPRFV